MCVCIYIYIYREREKEREKKREHIFHYLPHPKCGDSNSLDGPPIGTNLSSHAHALLTHSPTQPPTYAPFSRHLAHLSPTVARLCAKVVPPMGYGGSVLTRAWLVKGRPSNCLWLEPRAQSVSTRCPPLGCGGSV